MFHQLQAEITEAIRKSLPAQLSDVLNAELTRLRALEPQIERLTEARDQAIKQAEEKRTELAKHIVVNVRESEVLKREIAVSQREFKAELLEYKAEAANQARAEMRSIVADVFANSKFKYSHHESGSVPMPGGGGYPTTMPTSKTITAESQG